MLLHLFLDAVIACGECLADLIHAAGLLVRLRPEFAAGYPSVPPDRWLPAHRRQDDRGHVWLDASVAPPEARALPLFEAHLDIREAQVDDDGGPSRV